MFSLTLSVSKINPHHINDLFQCKNQCVAAKLRNSIWINTPTENYRHNFSHFHKDIDKGIKVQYFLNLIFVDWHILMLGL